MPTYEYICDACGTEFEKFQSIKADPIKACPNCAREQVRRKISGGAAIIFKGGGFYETDYRSDSYNAAKKKDTEGGAPAATTPDGKSDAAKPAEGAKADSTKSETPKTETPKSEAPKSEPAAKPNDTKPSAT